MQEVLTGSRTGEAALERWDQLPRLRAMLAEVLPTNRFWRERLGPDAAPRSAAEFRRLPLTSNEELSADASERPPFGSNLTYPIEAYTRFHQTSGTVGRPLPVLDTADSWAWWCDCWDAVLDAAGVRDSDRAFFPFSFAPFIGFWSAHAAVGRRGILTVPGGGASSGRRLRLLAQTGCTLLFCTPTYALHLAQVAEREGVDIAAGPVQRLILAGEPGGSQPVVRETLETAWRAEIFDHAGATEVGAYGIPCPRGRGVYVNEREFIAEVLEIGGEDPAAAGDLGELVITNLGRWGSPVIRYRTGDLVMAKREPEGLLLEGGVLGRVDHMMLVRGVNLHLSGIEAAVRRHAGGAEFRLTLTRLGPMDEAEVEVEALPEACRAVAQDVRDTFGVRVGVRSVRPESLPRFELKAARVRDLRG